MNDEQDISELVEEATLSFALGDTVAALEQLRHAVALHPRAFSIRHALAEIYFSERALELALQHAEAAAEIEPADVHIHTSLSRIWMEIGDKEKAEHHGARARMLGWKEELQSPPGGREETIG